jgi:4-amino-4-deoxy-L-arabinose transferase-like glycosyltransferase
MTDQPRSQIPLLAALWLLLVLVSIAARPLFPVDETRYAAVAWEMLTGNDWLVPHLNGEIYSHKPPLLFWLTALGWHALGVNEWWPRLLPALFIFFSLPLCVALARRLWPAQRMVEALAPWILLGSLLTAYCCSTLMLDSLLLFFTLLGMNGLLVAARGRLAMGWLVFAAALGLGLLSKGPVMLLHALPAALLAPLWLDHGVGPRPFIWYASLLGSTLSGVAIALSWALPAAAAGGEAYGTAILWDQTAHRIVSSFAHSRPWWWYLPWLFAVLYPWAVWPTLWRALSRLLRSRLEMGSRFCLAWLLPPFMLLSIVSGKQPQYLLTLLPGFALLSARALVACEPANRSRHRLPPALGLIALGLFFLALNRIEPLAWLPPWAAEMPLWAGGLLLLSGLVLLLLPLNERMQQVRALTCSTLLLLLILDLGPARLALPWHDLRGISAYIHDAQEAGRPVAHAGHYEGQYHFLGRLSEPLEEIDPADIERWATDNPAGLVIVYSRAWMEARRGKPDYSQSFRAKQVTAWSSRSILEGAAGE